MNVLAHININYCFLWFPPEEKALKDSIEAYLNDDTLQNHPSSHVLHAMAASAVMPQPLRLSSHRWAFWEKLHHLLDELEKLVAQGTPTIKTILDVLKLCGIACPPLTIAVTAAELLVRLIEWLRKLKPRPRQA